MANTLALGGKKRRSRKSRKGGELSGLGGLSVDGGRKRRKSRSRSRKARKGGSVEGGRKRRRSRKHGGDIDGGKKRRKSRSRKGGSVDGGRKRRRSRKHGGSVDGGRKRRRSHSRKGGALLGGTRKEVLIPYAVVKAAAVNATLKELNKESRLKIVYDDDINSQVEAVEAIQRAVNKYTAGAIMFVALHNVSSTDPKGVLKDVLARTSTSETANATSFYNQLVTLIGSDKKTEIHDYLINQKNYLKLEGVHEDNITEKIFNTLKTASEITTASMESTARRLGRSISGALSDDHRSSIWVISGETLVAPLHALSALTYATDLIGIPFGGYYNYLTTHTPYVVTANYF